MFLPAPQARAKCHPPFMAPAPQVLPLPPKGPKGLIARAALSKSTFYDEEPSRSELSNRAATIHMCSRSTWGAAGVTEEADFQLHFIRGHVWLVA